MAKANSLASLSKKLPALIIKSEKTSKELNALLDLIQIEVEKQAAVSVKDQPKTAKPVAAPKKKGRPAKK